MRSRDSFTTESQHRERQHALFHHRGQWSEELCILSLSLCLSNINLSDLLQQRRNNIDMSLVKFTKSRKLYG